MSEAEEVRFIRVPGAGLIEQKMKDLENSVRRFDTITNEWKDIKQKQRELRERIGRKIAILQDRIDKTVDSVPVIKEISEKRLVAPKRVAIEKRMEEPEPLPELPAQPVVKKRSEKLSQLRRELEDLQLELK